MCKCIDNLPPSGKWRDQNGNRMCGYLPHERGGGCPSDAMRSCTSDDGNAALADHITQYRSDHVRT